MKVFFLSILLLVNGFSQDKFNLFFKPIITRIDYNSISQYENSFNSKVINYSFQYHSWKLFDNNKFYPLTTHPLAFFRGLNQNFPCYVNYSFSTLDSSIISITYEWGNSPFEENLEKNNRYYVPQNISEYNKLFSELLQELVGRFGEPTYVDKEVKESDSQKLYPMFPNITIYERLAEWNKDSVYIKLRLRVAWDKFVTLIRYWE